MPYPESAPVNQQLGKRSHVSVAQNDCFTSGGDADTLGGSQDPVQGASNPSAISLELWKAHGVSEAQRTDVSKLTDKAMRSRIVSELQLKGQLEKFGEDPMHICPRCWVMKHSCICSKIDGVVQNLLHSLNGTSGSSPSCVGPYVGAPAQNLPRESVLPHSLVVLAHPCEVGKQTNSGALSLACQGVVQGRMIVPDTTAGDRAFEDEMRKPSTVVFFPSKEAMSASEAKLWATQRTGSSNLNVVLVDGTWSQAKTMNRRIPKEVPRITLTSAGDWEYKSPMRNQVGLDRLCSMAALVQLYKELGVDERVIQALYDVLILKAEVVSSAKGGNKKANRERDGREADPSSNRSIKRAQRAARKQQQETQGQVS